MTTDITPTTTGTAAAYERFAGFAALGMAVVALGLAVSYVVLQDFTLASVFLLLTGLLSAPVLLAVYYRLRTTQPEFAGFALLLGLIGALGALSHGGFDLAVNVIPRNVPTDTLPNPVDPRGLLVFGIAGLAMLLVGALILAGPQFPPVVGYLAVASGVLLVILYFGRLIVLDNTAPINAFPILLHGFLVNPLLYLLLGLALLRR